METLQILKVKNYLLDGVVLLVLQFVQSVVLSVKETSLNKSTTGDLDSLLVPGDVFEINEDDFRFIVQSPMMDGHFVRSKKLLNCQVLRVYIKSSVEIYYVCCLVNSPKREFSLRYLTEELFQIEFKGYSATVLMEARRELQVNRVFGNLYTKEDAERIKTYIESIKDKLVEKDGYLVNPNFSL